MLHICTLVFVAGLEKAKESYVPFWAVAAKVDVQLRGAMLGYSIHLPVYIGAAPFGYAI